MYTIPILRTASFDPNADETWYVGIDGSAPNTDPTLIQSPTFPRAGKVIGARLDIRTTSSGTPDQDIVVRVADFSGPAVIVSERDWAAPVVTVDPGVIAFEFPANATLVPISIRTPDPWTTPAAGVTVEGLLFIEDAVDVISGLTAENVASLQSQGLLKPVADEVNIGPA